MIQSNNKNNVRYIFCVDGVKYFPFSGSHFMSRYLCGSTIPIHVNLINFVISLSHSLTCSCPYDDCKEPMTCDWPCNSECSKSHIAQGREIQVLEDLGQLYVDRSYTNMSKKESPDIAKKRLPITANPINPLNKALHCQYV